MFDYLKGFFRNYFYEEEQFAALFLLIIAGVLLYFVGSTITPIFVSILIAYLLNGVMNFFEGKNYSKKIAFYFSFTIFLVFYFIVLVSLPYVTGQIASLLNELPAIVAFVENLFDNLMTRYPNFFTTEQVEEIFASSTSFIPSIAEQVLIQLNTGFSAIMNALIFLILTPILVFFFLKDKSEMLSYVTYFLPNKRILLSQIWNDLNTQLFGYVRGKALEMLIVGSVTTLAFLILGVNYSVILGILVGMSVLIPLFGAILVTSLRSLAEINFVSTS